jgi:hypothetical protein
MKKFIQLSKIILISAFMFTMSSCDIFENFLFNVPMSFLFESSGSSLFDDGSACLEDDDTFNDVQDKINDINFVEAYLAVLSISPENIQGDITFTLRGGNASGPVLIQQTLNDVRPADYPPASPLKLQFDQSQIQLLNQFLSDAENQRCFYGSFEITDLQNGGTTNSIQVRLDVLFNVDANLD